MKVVNSIKNTTNDTTVAIHYATSNQTATQIHCIIILLKLSCRHKSPEEKASKAKLLANYQRLSCSPSLVQPLRCSGGNVLATVARPVNQAQDVDFSPTLWTLRITVDTHKD